MLAVSTLFWAQNALAYRPFDGTDAEVADVGEFELELGPAQFYRSAGQSYVIAPSTVLNLGFLPNLEAVIDFKQFIANRAVSDEQRVRLLDTDVLLKWVLRPGALQGQRGVSVALEAGPLLPELGGERRFGAQANVIVSHRGTFGTVHFNEEAAFSRAGNLELFSSVILEAPAELLVRPVAEVFVEREFGAASEYSALLGAIWSAAESIAVDGALRMAREDGARAFEVRFGFTWSQAIGFGARPPRSGARPSSPAAL
jgi:hypothetical protein